MAEVGVSKLRPPRNGSISPPATSGERFTFAACFRRLRSLPFLCTSFYPNACRRPGPCNRSDLCTRALVVAFERQPSCVGRRRLGPRGSRRRHARLKTQLEGRQPRRRQLLLWMVSCINLFCVWLVSGRLRAWITLGGDDQTTRSPIYACRRNK